MSGKETLMQIRKDKHQELNGGTYPLADYCTPIFKLRAMFELTGKDEHGNLTGDIKTTIDPNELTDSYSYKIHGRVVAFRKSGAITFIKIADQTGSFQVIVSRSAFADYDKLSLIDLGDIIQVTGLGVYSKTGEESLLLESWTMLTKAHRPPPEKWAGINDQELKCRKRYLDLMSDEEVRARFVVRTYAIRAIRRFLENQEFLEVETSTLNTISSGANAKPFTTHHNALDIDLTLRIAPELYLKRLLVGGYEKVFEIGRNYRNEGVSTRHNPEFTMLETYQAYGKFNELIESTKAMLQSIDKFIESQQTFSHHSHAFAQPYFAKWRHEKPFTFTEFVEVTMEQAVQNALDKAQMRGYLDQPYYGEWYGFTPPEYCNDVALQRHAKTDFMGLLFALNKANSRGERLALFFEYLAEPFLTEDYRDPVLNKSLPVFITEYPKVISPLARANDTNPEICDRFELFVDGRELANAFQELNDPDEQARRFHEQLINNNKDPMDFDADYIQALEHGMPPAIGFGMGIDRLVMLLTNAPTIKDVILFPTLKPEK
jgi:lysyl-tRNA synthetase, class II